MNVVGETVTVLASADPTKRGLAGVVLLETAKTLLIESGSKQLRVEKAGSVFRVKGSGSVVIGSDIEGRLEDRLGRRTK